MNTLLTYRGYAIEVAENQYRLKLLPHISFISYPLITKYIDTLCDCLTNKKSNVKQATNKS